MITSDASQLGWARGYSCGKQTSRGEWNVQEQAQHINYLELKDAFFALQCFSGKDRALPCTSDVR